MASAGGGIVCVYRDKENMALIHICAAMVGGPEGVKADTWYTLSDGGEFVEVEE
jgi:hypothetical protein